MVGTWFGKEILSQHFEYLGEIKAVPSWLTNWLCESERAGARRCAKRQPQRMLSCCGRSSTHPRAADCKQTGYARFKYLRTRWQDLLGAQFGVLLHDLASSYFESGPPFLVGDNAALVPAGTSGPIACG